MSRIRRAFHWLGERIGHALETLMDLSMYLVSETILAIWSLICLICSKIYRSILMAYEGSIDIWYNNMKTENKRIRDRKESIRREREERRKARLEQHPPKQYLFDSSQITFQPPRYRYPPRNRI